MKLRIPAKQTRAIGLFHLSYVLYTYLRLLNEIGLLTKLHLSMPYKKFNNCLRCLTSFIVLGN